VAARDSFLAAERNGALAIPALPAAMFNVNGKDRACVDAQCTPHPLECLLQKPTLTRARERIGKKDIHQGDRLREQPFESKGKCQSIGLIAFYEVPCGHDAVLDMPERLAAILEETP
jgi:hypothetical protein